ncbi:hypothetical protein Lal_00024305 [Lupinus albus]|nr:hypothetical protein Lal_00024305 [Lupinus albus]
MRKDPKFGGGAGGTYEVAKNQTKHSPSYNIRGYVVMMSNFGSFHVDPPIPQPSTFHDESSSFVVMPTNEMIMYELFSLRGYITTRMGAIDAKNEQVQVEL